MSLGDYNYVAYMMYIVNCLVTTEEGVTNIHYVAYMMYMVNCSLRRVLLILVASELSIDSAVCSYLDNSQIPLVLRPYN